MPWKCLYSSFPGIEYECMAGLHNMVGWRDHATPLPPYAKICLDSPFVGGCGGGEGGRVGEAVKYEIETISIQKSEWLWLSLVI